MATCTIFTFFTKQLNSKSWPFCLEKWRKLLFIFFFAYLNIWTSFSCVILVHRLSWLSCLVWETKNIFFIIFYHKSHISISEDIDTLKKFLSEVKFEFKPTNPQRPREIIITVSAHFRLILCWWHSHNVLYKCTDFCLNKICMHI